MVYYFGEGAESSKYDVLVDASGEEKMLEILSDFTSDRVVNLGILRNTWRSKDFEAVVQEILEGFPNSSKVFFTAEAVKVINEFAVENRRRYYNYPKVRFQISAPAPATTPV